MAINTLIFKHSQYKTILLGVYIYFLLCLPVIHVLGKVLKNKIEIASESNRKHSQVSSTQRLKSL